MSDLKLNPERTSEIRKLAANSKKIKITINIDQESVEILRKMSSKTGVPYQKLLNQILREGLGKKNKNESRLDRLEREIAIIKKKLAA
jgi:predicted DNA binding CopG/RHH family protein